MRWIVAVNWLLRLNLIVVFLPHAIGKLTYTDTFATKFDLPYTVSLLTGVAEVLAVAGVLAGGILMHSGRWRAVAFTVTGLATLAIWIVQIGAIAVARWPQWLEYSQGAEYNMTLLVVSAVMLLSTVPIALTATRSSNE